MYRYDEFDETLVRERAKQFRSQVERRLKGELKEEQLGALLGRQQREHRKAVGELLRLRGVARIDELQHRAGRLPPGRRCRSPAR